MTRTTADNYVYLFQQGNKILEVVLTGRVATRKGRRKEVVLHEITSADPDLAFQDWVKKDQLFTIDEEEQ